MKDEYISNLESSTSIDESEERPHMNPSLKAALWCAPASYASACPQTKTISAFTGFTSLFHLLHLKDSKRLSHVYTLHERL